MSKLSKRLVCWWSGHDWVHWFSYGIMYRCQRCERCGLTWPTKATDFDIAEDSQEPKEPA